MKNAVLVLVLKASNSRVGCSGHALAVGSPPCVPPGEKKLGARKGLRDGL